MDFLVGTFRSPLIFTLQFSPTSSSLSVIKTSPAISGHSWLALSNDHQYLYATCWMAPPSVAAYRLRSNGTVEHLNTKPIKALSGYVACTATHLYTVGGPSGEVFSLDADGSIGDLVQELSFRKASELSDGARNIAHGNFGGLRHGAHSIDLAPDGTSLYVADIGHNCIWTYSVAGEAAVKAGAQPLSLGTKHVSPRATDGPRHTWPHPSARVLYSLQEHSSMVDVFSIAADGVTLAHVQGVKVIPEDKDPDAYWADEVRVSRTKGSAPRYLYASTRGLEPETMGYVAAFRLDAQGLIQGEALHIFETATSGGLANAVEPAPLSEDEPGEEFLALTDSHEGLVFVLGFDGTQFREIARTTLRDERGDPVGCATAVWL